MDLAQLGLSINSSEAVQATGRLSQMTRAGESAERMTTRMGRSVDGLARQLQHENRLLGRGVSLEQARNRSRLKAQGATVDQIRQIERLQAQQAKLAATSQTSFGRMTSAVGRARMAVLSLQGALVGVGAILVFRKIMGDFAEFERGLIQVGKTADLEGRRLDQLGERIQMIGREVAIPTNRLLELASAAGQLGVKGVENISSFAETLGKMETATDVAGEDGARALARLLNITDEAISDVDRLGSSITALGNNFATTENEIVRMSTFMGASTQQFDLTAAEVVGLSAALRSLGQRAETAGSATGAALAEIDTALASSGEKMDTLTRLTGQSADELRRAFGENAVDVLLDFAGALDRLPTSEQTVILEQFNLAGRETRRVIGALSSDVEMARRAIAMANEEWTRNEALNVEAAKAAESFSAQMVFLGNALNEAAVDIGRELAPVILDITRDFRDFIEAASDSGDLERFFEDVATAAQGLRDVVQEIAEFWQIISGIPGILTGAPLRNTVTDALEERAEAGRRQGTPFSGGGPSIVDEFGRVRLPGGGPSNTPMIFRRDDRPAGGGGGTASTNEEVKQRLEQLRKEVALFGELSNAEATRIALSEGFYGEVTPEQKKELIRLARILDQKEANLEASEKQAEAEKDRLDQVQKLERALETEEDAAHRIYRNRKTLIERNVEDEERRAELIRRNEKQLAEDLAEIRSRNASEIEKLFDNAVENIQRSFGDMFTDIFRNGLSGFEDFTDRVKDIFARLAGEIAAVFAQRAIGDIILGATGGTGALADIARKMGGGQGGITGAISDLPGGGGIASKVVDGVAKRLGLGGAGAGTLVQRIGAKIGFAGDVQAVTRASQGTAQGLTARLPGSLGGALAAAGGGFAGSELGRLVGQRFGGETGGRIGGGFGGAVGSIAGPIGSLIGSAAGSFFGSGLDRLISGGSSTAERLTGGLDVMFPGIGSAISAAFGIGDQSAPRLGLRTTAEDLGGFKGKSFVSPFGRVGISNQTSETAGTGLSDSKLEPIARLVQATDEQLAQFLTETQVEAVRSALQEQKNFSRSRIGDDGDIGNIFAKRFVKIFEALEMEIPQELRKLTGKGKGAAKTIQAFMQPLKQMYIERVQAITDEINSITSEIQAQVEELLQFRQAFAQAGDSISDQLFRMTGTSASPLSPTEQLSNARAQFEDLLSRSQSGDVQALQQVSASAANFLDLARQNFASSPEFFERFDFVQDSLSGLQGVISEQQGRITDVMSDLNINIDRQTQLTVGRLDTLIEATRGQSDRLDELNDRLDRLEPQSDAA